MSYYSTNPVVYIENIIYEYEQIRPGQLEYILDPVEEFHADGTYKDVKLNMFVRMQDTNESMYGVHIPSDFNPDPVGSFAKRIQVDTDDWHKYDIPLHQTGYPVYTSVMRNLRKGLKYRVEPIWLLGEYISGRNPMEDVWSTIQVKRGLHLDLVCAIHPEEPIDLREASGFPPDSLLYADGTIRKAPKLPENVMLEVWSKEHDRDTKQMKTWGSYLMVFRLRTLRPAARGAVKLYNRLQYTTNTYAGDHLRLPPDHTMRIDAVENILSRGYKLVDRGQRIFDMMLPDVAAKFREDGLKIHDSQYSLHQGGLYRMSSVSNMVATGFAKSPEIADAIREQTPYHAVYNGSNTSHLRQYHIARVKFISSTGDYTVVYGAEEEQGQDRWYPTWDMDIERIEVTMGYQQKLSHNVMSSPVTEISEDFVVNIPRYVRYISSGRDTRVVAAMTNEERQKTSMRDTYEWVIADAHRQSKQQTASARSIALMMHHGPEVAFKNDLSRMLIDQQGSIIGKLARGIVTMAGPDGEVREVTREWLQQYKKDMSVE